jgi:hypothetical protein
LVFGRKSADIGRLFTRVAWVLVAAGSVALFGSGGGDDSHITWWVVDELVRTGHFHNFNGVALKQSSSLALGLIAAIARSAPGLPTPVLGVGISVAALSATCWMTSRVARRLSEDLALPATLLVATSGPLVYWATSGMETALATFSVAWLLDAIGYCLEQSDTTQSRRRALGCCLRVVPASALFVSVRPEKPADFRWNTRRAPSVFVLELGRDRRLHIPPQFDAAALERLLVLLERR